MNETVELRDPVYTFVRGEAKTELGQAYRTCGLVQEEDVWFVGESPSNGHPLLLTTCMQPKAMV